MAFSFLLVLLVLMATGGGRGRTRGSRGTSKRTRQAEESEGSDPDYQGEEVEEEEEEADEPVSRPDKGKGISGEPSRGVGATRERRAKRTAEVPPERARIFSARSCIAERQVNFRDLTEQVPEFGRLLLRAPIEPVGNVGARAPFCVELVREFYLRGVVLAEDEETETYIFETSVRGNRVIVTPHDIGDILGMAVDVLGLHYTAGPLQSSTDWDTVIEAICKPGVRTDRSVVESKDLRPEYHLLSLIMCYNVQPTIGTKRIRWDRLVLLYLLGHPEQAHGLNMNIPFLIWQRMVHVIQTALRRELLPFPLLITRILQANGVDISCNKYDYGLGAIDAVTWAKSVSTLKTFQQTKGHPQHATSSTAAPSQPPSAPSRRTERPEPAGSSSSGGVITLDSLHRDVSTLHHEVGSLKKGFKRLEEGIKRILEKMGCRHDDIFPQSTTYQRSTSRLPFLHPSADAPEAGGSGSPARGDDDDDDEATE